MSAADTVAIRLAKPEDADALPGIEKAASRLFAAVPDLATLANADPLSAERYRNLIAKRHCLVAASGQRIAGFIACEPFRRELHIWEISVHPDFQRRGLGERLLRAAMIDAHNEGFTALTLTTFRDVAWNAPFYTRLGFIEIEDEGSNMRLDTILADEAQSGLKREDRVAMIRFLG